ncbi:hypothetical protein CTI12_AA083060 [Artemisia annua]|uniref:Uncharacterized protein n=1 Tax=Artemisia annua TaxID=35608 RepID=A0A2U1PVU3_ARTAN|nr:hypothetical protein CTI12_AA083060 [Artemisia annua]
MSGDLDPEIIHALIPMVTPLKVQSSIKHSNIRCWTMFLFIYFDSMYSDLSYIKILHLLRMIMGPSRLLKSTTSSPNDKSSTKKYNGYVVLADKGSNTKR